VLLLVWFDQSFLALQIFLEHVRFRGAVNEPPESWNIVSIPSCDIVKRKGPNHTPDFIWLRTHLQPRSQALLRSSPMHFVTISLHPDCDEDDHLWSKEIVALDL
jgi:hypothetical protein